MQEYVAKVLEIEKYIDGNLEFEIVRIEKKIDFLPGQAVMLALDDFKLKGNPELPKWTTYSIASSPDENYLEFCIRIKDTPGFSNYLAQNLKEGDSMNVKGPFGRFLLNPNSSENVFIATGAGIAPFMSMIKYLVRSEDEKPITLFYGFRTHDQFLYRDTLETFENLDNFSFYPITSREEYKGNQGHVQKLLNSHNFTKEEDVYLCGSKDMMEDVEKLLESKGLDKNKIHIEKW